MKIMNELGGWPILQGEKWSGEKFVWQKQEGNKKYMLNKTKIGNQKENIFLMCWYVRVFSIV